MADVKLTGVHKYYGNVHAVRGLDLTISDGEFAVLVGPSGCGKSTLLRTIAGLEDPDDGTIAIGGAIVNDLRPRERNIAMVFQNYALYPYLTVNENIAFGLRARKTPEIEIRKRVSEAAEMLGIGNLLQRYPRQLSGGQRQRVAIGRAIVRKADLFLFDEPLSNLDAQLRDEMRTEIKRLHHEITTTMIYVTHDQVEAMTLADRIVLLRDGKIEQQGAPLELFERPRTGFVAGFLGSPSINLIPATLTAMNGGLSVVFGSGESLTVPPAKATALSSVAGREVIVGIRPQHFGRAGDGPLRDGVVPYSAVADLIQPTGTRTFTTIKIGGVDAVAELQAHDVQSHGERIQLAIDLNRMVLIDPATGSVIA
ncbi:MULTISPECIES: ABC transporter ATP-binding protein [Bradyrhizobium]|uniref:Sugar ABC transporter ATP-binding protein n=3 Tax=Bradyrhizobium TaxID=374 RepID=A0A410VIU7_9BRAD|nr:MULTISPECIES: ABC transporter ATP-binding protein [Bradyrhizobium]MCG2628059.1 ABC transporter ATP-binding protein [Bradyrhizobium zhengyangense]MCG2643178.1 ABC transporter ATP-binding protein [Bradyrhizobium zhengyangense]MCG2670508.1 ABC transporter ATP-binding protein [Bradyrhizobium zhengyangense]MDN4985757.1 ABC transporter ATP-binding protein [Bradyrhizobium sp. WYCCWR 13022]MDT4736598.1 ABC transporter ATP-binding protein [Bradyrhizobium sp. WYCCWR 12699]